ncbi:MAG: AMP-binding protein, partial [Planctomycetota bacterium]
SFYHSLWLKPVMKFLGAIPISGSNQKELLRALKRAGEYLERGELVCIFAEGEISRTGVMLPFRRGLERILKDRDVPVIPCHLDQVWGSVFSHRGGGFLKSLDGPVPRPVTVSFGPPLPPTTSAAEIRMQVSLLDEAAWSMRSAGRRPLHHELSSRARRAPFRMALTDSSGTSLSRIKALAGSIALARALRKHWLDQERVGILLPPSVACGLANFAAALSGRVSVNLNYTAGKAGLEAAARQAGLRTVLTNREFLEKAGIQLPDSAEPIWIEDLRPQIGFGARLLALLFAALAPKRLLERLCGARRPTNIDDVVTIIFSSGSTGDPKGVMLSHANIDANVEATIQVLSPGKNDRILGVLPQFHAFGYMALWFATNSGMATVFHNNPVDAAVIGPLVQKHRVTFLIATPTFLQVYMRRCSPGQFGSLRMVMTGAEKLNPQVREAFQDRFGVALLEGYGATECSPGIALSAFDYRATGFYQPGRRRGYVGQALPGVAVRAVDPDTYEDLAPNTPGMLLVKGPNVMQGYLDRPDLTAAAMHDDGWYITGDIACIDEDGFVKITDRFARFSKIGGEMVPHGKVEEALHELVGATEQVFCVTGIPDQKKGEKLAVLHMIDEGRLPKLLEDMTTTGLPNLFIPKVEQFVKVAEFPVLGTGKTDLKAVKKVAMDALGVRT